MCARVCACVHTSACMSLFLFVVPSKKVSYEELYCVGIYLSQNTQTVNTFQSKNYPELQCITFQLPENEQTVVTFWAKNCEELQCIRFNVHKNEETIATS